MESDLVEHKLAYRVGYLNETDWRWQRKDRELMHEARREIEHLRRALAEQSRLNEEMKAEAYRRGVEDAAKVAEAQPFYPDTHTGMRQQWIKDQIAATIRSLPVPKEGE